MRPTDTERRCAGEDVVQVPWLDPAPPREYSRENFCRVESDGVRGILGAAMGSITFRKGIKGVLAITRQ